MNGYNIYIVLVVVQLLSRVWLFVIPWTAAHQAFLSITNSRSLLKLMSIESVMPSNHLILCFPVSSWLLSFPASGFFFFFFQIFTLNFPYVNKILHEGEEQFQSSEIRTVFDVFYSESYYFYIVQEWLFVVVVVVCLFWWLNFFFSPIAVDFFLILTIMCHKFLVFICVLDIYANT